MLTTVSITVDAEERRPPFLIDTRTDGISALLNKIETGTSRHILCRVQHAPCLSAEVVMVVPVSIFYAELEQVRGCGNARVLVHKRVCA